VFDSYYLLKLAHVLLFVYWLGSDLGVFYSALYVRDRTLSVEARRTAARILVWIDQVPRYCLVLMLPVGYTLALRIGVVRLPPAFILVLWAIGLVWLWAVWAIHHYQGSAFGERIRRIDLGWRYVLFLGLLWDGWQGFSGAGHLLTGWVSLKFWLFAAILFCGIMIRTLGKQTAPTLAQIFATGSTPELEQALRHTGRRTRPFVLAMWALLVIAAYVGISKPELGLSP